MSFRANSLLTVRALFGMRPTRGEFGVELELEGTGPLGTAVPGWDVHEEGSLRAPGGHVRGGAEYVTRGAVGLNGIIPLVNRLNEVFTQNNIVVDGDAHRSSTHIHRNVQDESISTVFGFMVLFTVVEPLMLHLCGHKRDGNAFCSSSFECGDLAPYMKSFCDQIARMRSSAESGWTGWDARRGKYAALSTFRLMDLGTLEIRCFPQSVNPADIHMWCVWVDRILTMARNNDDRTFRNFVKEATNNPLGIMMDVFGFRDIPQPKVRDLLRLGAQEAYELSRILKHAMSDVQEPKKAKKLPETEAGGLFALGALNAPLQRVDWNLAPRRR